MCVDKDVWGTPAAEAARGEQRWLAGWQVERGGGSRAPGVCVCAAADTMHMLLCRTCPMRHHYSGVLLVLLVRSVKSRHGAAPPAVCATQLQRLRCRSCFSLLAVSSFCCTSRGRISVIDECLVRSVCSGQAAWQALRMILCRRALISLCVARRQVFQCCMLLLCLTQD